MAMMNTKPTITTTDWTRNDGAQSTLKQPTLNELLAITFDERQYLLWPWLREQESCMVYAAAGVGKSLFALSAAIAVAGGGSFLGWKVGGRANGGDWRVIYFAAIATRNIWDKLPVSKADKMDVHGRSC
jgi:hypothetical protein